MLRSRWGAAWGGRRTHRRPESREVDLIRASAGRIVDPEEIGSVWEMLNQRDPAGVLFDVERAVVEAVAIYLQGRAAGMWLPAPEWGLIVGGHPAARAVFLHERAELDTYGALGIRQPLRVRRPGPTYAKADALAAWQEAEYWEAWAGAKGEVIPASGFLEAHPLLAEQPDAIRRRLDLLATVWRVAIRPASSLELEQARRFYALQELTPAGIERWRRRSATGRS